MEQNLIEGPSGRGGVRNSRETWWNRRNIWAAADPPWEREETDETSVNQGHVKETARNFANAREPAEHLRTGKRVRWKPVERLGTGWETSWKGGNVWEPKKPLENVRSRWTG